MKYLLRLFGVIFLWPIKLFFMLVFFVIANLAIILWYLNFKHCFGCELRDFYFYLITNGSELSDIDIQNGKCSFESYDMYYKNPIDMLLDKRTKEIKK